MSAHHFFVEPESIEHDVVTLTGEEARHAARVVRLRLGEQISVADGSGRVVDAVVRAVGDVVEADIIEMRHIDRPRPELTLYQALTKGDKIDLVIEKATEVGVTRIVPFVSSRTIVRWDAAKRERMCERWSAVAKSAAKQSKSPWIPVVGPIADQPSVEPDVATFVLHESADKRLRDVLPSQAPAEITLVVGPEGGFGDEEVGDLRAGGATVVGLGPRILRTETAGLVAATIVAYTYGSLG